MKNQSNPIFISAFLLIFLNAALITAQEVEDEREFVYDERNNNGPSRWGELKKEWATCKNGPMQSPIDIPNQVAEAIPKSGEIRRNYKPSNATLMNRGHDITLKWAGDAGSIQINDTVYLLQQLHWHAPSEHTINAKRYDMELHMIHMSPDLNVKNRIVVVGILYKIGQSDVFLSKLSRNIAPLMDGLKENSAGKVDPRDIKVGGTRYYMYTGSLTMPPCSEEVIWIIKEEVATVSQEQINFLRDTVHDYAQSNARPLQPLNRREIHLYGLM
ncbi:alpha carbonic anhydrase 7-like [Cornus florida]|uniref:alpha carbonic anhydrase 7-like n=1 Tax=Cornus florida TaxID=4283 RepID=UPI002898E784|nr:alpha carbonic anhydrase 7-like [Cornus florida]